VRDEDSACEDPGRGPSIFGVVDAYGRMRGEVWLEASRYDGKIMTSVSSHGVVKFWSSEKRVAAVVES
jgi:hypothetical protein